MDIKVTVFTPTYNRGYIIKNLYKSLLNQTYKDFEWLIVNDGSSDETDKLIRTWIEDAMLQIKYINLKKNRGIANAMNIGIQEAVGDLFFKVDSDDMIIPEAIEKIIYYETTIIDKNNFAGVAGFRFFKNQRAIGEEWKSEKLFIDATNFERKRYHLNGDKSEAYYIEVLRKYLPLPFFEDEPYAFEGILWNRIANDGLKIRWFKDKICETEYLDDGLSLHFFEDCKKNYNAYTLYVNEYKNFKRVSLMEKYMVLVKYFALSFAKGISRKDLPNHFDWNYWWLGVAYFHGKLLYFFRILLKPNKYKNCEIKR